MICTEIDSVHLLHSQCLVERGYAQSQLDNARTPEQLAVANSDLTSAKEMLNSVTTDRTYWLTHYRKHGNTLVTAQRDRTYWIAATKATPNLSTMPEAIRQYFS